MMGAIAVHHTATTDAPWDGPAAVAAMPNDKAVLHYCHAWQADDAGDEKSAYKFPHHTKSGGPANLAACRNGLARLSGASIPDGDRAGVKAHLQAHLDDANKSAGDAFGREIENLASEWTERGLARAQGRGEKHPWYRITDAGESTEVHILDSIGGWGISAADFMADLAAVKSPRIGLHINSGGGDVFDGLTIYNTLRQRGGVDVHVDGLAASIASVIAMAGDTVTVAPASMMMVHDASVIDGGNAHDHRQIADLLDKVSDMIAGVYAAHTDRSAVDWRAVMLGEQWYTGDEAVQAGLATAVSGVPAPVNLTRLDGFRYRYKGRGAAPAPVAIRPAPVSATQPPATPNGDLFEWYNPSAFADEFSWFDASAFSKKGK